MITFAWRRRVTRHFGEQWVPFAELSLKSTRGRWYSISMQVDSGAVISVVPRSVAELLGLRLVNDQPIELASVGAKARGYFVHLVEARIGNMPEFEMRIAVAEGEDVPNLLGRLDVLDRFQIDLDASLEETRVSTPWLDADGRRIWRHLLETEATILKKWSDHRLPGRVDEAAKRFVNRADQLLAAGAGLLKLHRGFELPLILRSLFELSVQFEYLMRDPEPRAALYLDYEHITKHRAMHAWAKLPGTIGDHLRASPLRAEGEERARREYNRVHAQYALKRDAERVRRHWYQGSLRDLANDKDVQRLPEYEAIYGLYSAWAHGDPWTSDPLKVGHGGLMHLYGYWARLMIQVADAKRIILAGDSYRTLQQLGKGTA